MTVVSVLTRATTADRVLNSPTARARVARMWPAEMLSTVAPAATSVAYRLACGIWLPAGPPEATMATVSGRPMAPFSISSRTNSAPGAW